MATKKYLDENGLLYYHQKAKATFVAKEAGKGLSTNDYTTAEKTKLAGIEDGAEVNTIDGRVVFPSPYDIGDVYLGTDNDNPMFKAEVVSYSSQATDKVLRMEFSPPYSVDPYGDDSVVFETSPYTEDDKYKLDGIEDNAQENVIETVKVNGTALTPDINKAVTVTVPTNNNQLTNGAGYQTSSDVQSAINTAISGVTSFDYQIVASLPASGVKGTIYLVSHSGSGTEVYDEYIWVNNAWEKIGTTDVDLSNYYTKTQVDGLIPTKVSDLTNDSGFTTNTGTITGVSANGTSVATSGVANIPAATTSKYGVTKLSSSTSSTSTSLAATASAVKAVYDLANGKQSPATTIAGYGITDAYTKTEVDGMISSAGEENVIETVKVNGTALTPDANKAVDIPAASTADYGVTKLSSSTSSTSTSLAATPSAVKAAYDLANGKQDALTAGTNITISSGTISATDTTYSAGTGLTLSGTQFSLTDTMSAISNSEIDTIVAS